MTIKDILKIRTIEDRIEIANQFITWVSALINNEADEDTLEDLNCLHMIARHYHDEMIRNTNGGRLSETDYYRIRNSSMVASIMLEELIEDGQLQDWSHGQPENGNVAHTIGTLLSDAILKFQDSMLNARMRNFRPLSEAEINAAVNHLL